MRLKLNAPVITLLWQEAAQTAGLYLRRLLVRRLGLFLAGG